MTLKTRDLRIRKDLKWYSGRDLTADDIAWNLKQVLEPNTGSSVLGLMKGYMLNDVASDLWDASAIEIVDGKTVRMNLRAPQIAVPEHLFHYPLAILVARDNYYGEGPYVDRVELVDLGDGALATLAAISSSQVQGSYEVTIQQIEVFKEIPGVNVHETTTANTGVAHVQGDLPEFQDPRVRKALRLAVDSADVPKLAYANSGAPGEHH